MTDLNKLLNWFADKDRVLVSLSGGVDSALVAYAANKKLGKNAIAVTADYKTLSSEELDSAKLVAHEIGITHHLIEYSELENENFVQNDNKRCFYCRDELSKELIKLSNCPLELKQLLMEHKVMIWVIIDLELMHYMEMEYVVLCWK